MLHNYLDNIMLLQIQIRNNFRHIFVVLEDYCYKYAYTQDYVKVQQSNESSFRK